MNQMHFGLEMVVNNMKGNRFVYKYMMEKKILEICRKINKDIPEDCSIRLIDEGYIDSFGVFTIMAEIEIEYNILLNDEDMVYEHFKNINSIVELVQTKMRR